MVNKTWFLMRGKLTPAEVRNVIAEACKKKNYDPFEELIELATSKTTVTVNGEEVEVHTCDTDQRIIIAKEIASYMAPKLKNVEVRGEVTGDIHITVKNFTRTAIQEAVEVPQKPPQKPPQLPDVAQQNGN